MLIHPSNKIGKRRLLCILMDFFSRNMTRKNEAFDRGAFDFLVKPIRDHDLSSKIQKVIDFLL